MKTVLDENLRQSIIRSRRARYEAANALHEPSGKLSAGQLAKPLLEQVLRIIGVPTKPSEDYSLGLFERGDQVEEGILKDLQPDQQQVEVNYRGCIGFVDAIKQGHIYEVKSLKNSAIPYIDPENTKKVRQKEGGLKLQYTGPKFQHLLQGGLYALALGQGEFTIIYVSCDDLRTYPHIIQTADVKPRIDSIITEVTNQLKSGELPEFKPREDFNGEVQSWQFDTKYAAYPEWISLDPELAMQKLERQYPDSYRKLKSYGETL